MRTMVAVASGIAVTALAAAVVGTIYVRATGLESRSTPGPLETRLARAARSAAVPASLRSQRNPTPSTPENLAEGMAHFADHCASCHANDGSGTTAMGRGLYPKAPDMRLSATQDLSDGELFFVIENGIRFTGMPAWSTGTKAGEESTWHLVQFIRYLPQLTAAEVEAMTQLNPRSPADVRQEIEEEQFLNEGAQR